MSTGLLAWLTTTDVVRLDFEPYIAKEFGLSLALVKAAVCPVYAKAMAQTLSSSSSSLTTTMSTSATTTTTTTTCVLLDGEPRRCAQGTHPARGKTVVCKHWLRGLCKKGDACEFLHEYNMRKMPECWFFAKYGECSNTECIYLHIDPLTRRRECGDYARGFCRLGPVCRHKHTRRALCALYMTGFCPRGAANCDSGHPRIADAAMLAALSNMTGGGDEVGVGSVGSGGSNGNSGSGNSGGGSVTHVPPLINPPKHLPHPQAYAQQQQYLMEQSRRTAPTAPTCSAEGNSNGGGVVCYRCGGRGHYASQCSRQ